jgi:hypothetical protein
MTSTRSLPGTGAVLMTGVWLHDPDDPEATAVNYVYGGGKSDTLDTMGQGTLYAGREYPIVDFGEGVNAEVSVTIQVPAGSTWASELASLDAIAAWKRTVMYRDSRGRKVPGVVKDYARSDQRWGTEVTFTITQVDFTEVV